MNWLEVLKVGASIILSVGSAGGIILVLSGWLGKVWATRIMESDRARHAEELERIRARLVADNQASLDRLKSELTIQQEKHLKEHADKLAIYRLSVDIICDLLADFDLTLMSSKPPADMFDKFNRRRMKAYAYLAMMAPQGVMDAFDRLTDYLLAIIHGEKKHDWPTVRGAAIHLKNHIRIDFAIDNSPISYRGER